MTYRFNILLYAIIILLWHIYCYQQLIQYNNHVFVLTVYLHHHVRDHRASIYFNVQIKNAKCVIPIDLKKSV